MNILIQILGRNYIRIGLIYFLISFSFLSIKSQTPRFEEIEIIKNKNNYIVNCIFQDKIGFIWFGTSEGLYKHNGIDYKKQKLPDSLKSENITAIGEDNNGILWLGLKNGNILFSENKSFILFNPEEGLSQEEISSFFISKNNTLWFSTLGEGIYCYRGNTRKRLYNIDTDDGLADNNAYCFVEGKDSLLYIGTDNGISIYNPINMEISARISMKDGLPDNLVKHMVFNKETLWIGMNDEGICKYNLEEKSFESYGNLYDEVNDFICLDKDEIWVSVKRGIIRINLHNSKKPIIDQFTTAHGLIKNSSNTIFTDREKNIWIGSKGGISKRKGNYFEFLDQTDGVPFTNVFGLLSDQNGNKWIASESGLFVIRIDKDGKKNITRLFNDQKYNDHSFISVYEDLEGNIWAGTYGYGVYKINTSTLKYEHFDSNKEMSNDNIIHINDDSLSVWFSTLGGGITRLVKETGVFEHVNLESHMQSNYIYSTYTDASCKIWIAADGGKLSYYDKNKVDMPKIPDSLYSHVIYKIEEDTQGNIWFITANQGVYRYDGRTIYNINEANGLRTNNLMSFVIANNGDLILVHNLGIDIYDPIRQSFTYYGENYNIANLNPGLNAIYKDREGDIWIGHKTGLLLFKPDNYEKEKVFPEVFISNVQMNFNDLNENRNNFKYNENHFRFYYLALWYKDPESIKYRHILEGEDKIWIESGANKMANYSNLNPGKYSFKVQASNSQGSWYGSDNATFSFTVKKPFWETIGFIIFFIIAIILFIAWYIKARLERLKKEKEHLEDEVRKRTHEILMQKEEIEAQRDEIEAQRDEVTNQRDKIIEQNENITASIHYASRIQNAILPDLSLFESKFSEYFIFNKPRDIVSGDFYFISSLIDGSTVVLAADCTGHGVPGAFMSILGMSQLKEILTKLRKDNLKASLILETLRDYIKTALKQTGKDNEAKDGMDISLCIINHDKMKLQFAGAYNPLFIIRNGELTIIKGDRMPIGIQLNEKPNFINHEVEIKQGDNIYMFSDGYSDQLGGSRPEKFKPKRFKELLINASSLPMKKQLDIIEDQFNKWMDLNFQVDDVLIVGVRI